MKNMEKIYEWILPEFTDNIKRISDCYSKSQGYEIKPIYKNEKTEYAYLSSIEGSIYFGNFVLVFIYTAHGILSINNSILECKFIFDKSQNSLRYSLMDIFNTLDINDFRCYTIPSVFNIELMNNAFTWIAAGINDHIKEINDLSVDENKKNTLYENFKKDIILFYSNDVFNNKSIDDEFLETHYAWLRERFCLDTYHLYLKGNYPKAIEKYTKMKKSLHYEKRLTEFMRKTVEDNNAVLSDTLLKQIIDVKKESTGIRELMPMLFSWLVLCPFCFGFYTVIYYLFLTTIRTGAVFIAGPELFTMFLPSFLSAIVISYFTRFRVYKLFYKQSYERKTEMDTMTNGKKGDKFMKRFGSIIFICCIIGIALYVNCNITFKDNGFVDNTKFFSIRGDFHSYKNVDYIYYMPDRVNTIGGTMDFDSYVIVLKNGHEIDLYEFSTTESTRDNILPILSSKNIPIYDTKP